jgi:hypothetical protein
MLVVLIQQCRDTASDLVFPPQESGEGIDTSEKASFARMFLFISRVGEVLAAILSSIVLKGRLGGWFTM